MMDDSHYGVDQGKYRRCHLAGVLDGLVSSTKGSAETIKQATGPTMQVEWVKEQRSANVLQTAFDGTDTPQTFAKLGCSISLD